MKFRSPLAIAALTGIVAAGSLAATLSTAAPALADDHHGAYNQRDHGGYDARDRHDDRYRDRDRRDDHRGYAPAYVYQNPGYVPAYQYPAYYGPPPSSGYIHVSTPGFSAGFGF